MSTGKTTYLGLHRWEPDDDFLRTEFNENSDKLDEELELIQKEMTGEFSAVRGELSAGLSSVKSELNDEISAVQTSVNGKAAAAHNHGAGEITSGTLPVARGGTGVTTLAGLVTALKGAGAIQVEAGSYTGTGTYGADNPNTLTFGFVPKLVIVLVKGSAGMVASDQGSGFIWISSAITAISTSPNRILGGTLSGKTLSWYAPANSAAQLNNVATYVYVAVG